MCPMNREGERRIDDETVKEKTQALEAIGLGIGKMKSRQGQK